MCEAKTLYAGNPFYENYEKAGVWSLSTAKICMEKEHGVWGVLLNYGWIYTTRRD